MNTYIAFYNNQQKTVNADTKLKAQMIAATMFRAKKSYQVAVVLHMKDDEVVTHTGAEF